LNIEGGKMSNQTANSALNREAAVILIEEAKTQIANKDLDAARASLKEAAGMDPENLEVWQLLVTVSSGAEKEEYLKRAKRKKSRLPANPYLLIAGIAGVVLLAVLAIAGYAVYRFFTTEGPDEEVDDTILLTPERGGKINFQGIAGLYVPANALPQEAKFRLVVAADAPEFPQSELFSAFGSTIKVETTASALNSTVWFVMKYDGLDIPSGTDPRMIRVVKWDGTSWGVTDGRLNLDQKMIYVPVAHFSQPAFKLIAWSPKADSALLSQLIAANDLYFKDSQNLAVPQMYTDILASVSGKAAYDALSPTDQQGYWTACNLLGDSLYDTAAYARAGQAYQNCVQKALDFGVKAGWVDRLLTGPGYSLSALQDRFPLGVNLTNHVRSSAWAAALPQDLLTLYPSSYFWEKTIGDDLNLLPEQIRQDVVSFDTALKRDPKAITSTSIKMLVLSPQALEGSALDTTMQNNVAPFVETSGLTFISKSNIASAQITQNLKNFVTSAGATNRYIGEPVQAGEARHTHAPMLLMRVSRAWQENDGTYSYAQFVYALGTTPSEAAPALGAPLAEDSTYQLKARTFEQNIVSANWLKIGSDKKDAIQPSFTYTDQGMAAGAAHTCALNDRKGVVCWGSNNNGQLGLGDSAIVNKLEPGPVADLDSGVQALAAGENHTCALLDNGTVQCWGMNTSGQLGIGSTEGQNRPARVVNLDLPVTAIAAGENHTCALAENGQVLCWGYNADGQLGNNTDQIANAPVFVSGLPAVKSISAGGTHTCAVTVDGGKVYCWGANGAGQLGNNQTANSLVPLEVSGLSEIKTVAAGAEHTCAITAKDSVKCWGANANGQAGQDPRSRQSVMVPTDVKGMESGALIIEAYGDRTCVIVLKGVKCWGLKVESGGGTAQYLPESVALKEMNYISLAIGGLHSCARTEGGYMYSWGRGEQGQIGNGSAKSSDLPAGVVGFGTVRAGKNIQFTPSTEKGIEVGVALTIAPADVDEQTAAKTGGMKYYVSLDSSKTFDLIGEAKKFDPNGWQGWKATRQDLGKTAVIKIELLDQQGRILTEYLSNPYRVIDSFKPVAKMAVEPPNKTIELGSTVRIVADQINDAANNNFEGTGVKEIIFAVYEDDAKTDSKVVPYTGSGQVEMSWPAPMQRKKHNTTIKFSVTVVDHAGNENELEPSEHLLSDTTAPSFVSNMSVTSDGKAASDTIEMGAKVTVSINASDLIDNSLQGSGIQEANFFVSTDSGATFNNLGTKQTFRDAPTTQTISSDVWDSANPKILSGAVIVFRIRIVDAAGNVKETTSSGLKMVDTTKPTAQGMEVTPNNTGDAPVLKISVKGIEDGLGVGVGEGKIKITCNNKEVSFTPSENYIADFSTNVTLPMPDAACGYDDDIQVTLQLTDKDKNVNENAVSQTAKYLFDITAPKIEEIKVSESPIITKGKQNVTVKIFNETGGSDLKTLTVTITCVKNKTTITKTKELPTEGYNTLDWEADDSSTSTCEWGNNYKFHASVTDNAGNSSNDDPSKDVEAVNKVDETAPVVTLTVDGKENQGDILSETLPKKIQITATDQAGGSGVISLIGIIKTNGVELRNFKWDNTGQAIAEYTGPYPCEAADYIFEAQDRKPNLSKEKKKVTSNYTSSSKIAAKTIDYPENLVTAKDSFTITVTLLEPCDGIKSGKFEIFLKDTLVIDQAHVTVTHDREKGEVTITGTLTEQQKQKIKMDYNGKTFTAPVTLTSERDLRAGTFTTQFDLTQVRVYGDPTNITLSSTLINENQAAGTTVGTLSAADPDKDEKNFVYSLVAGSGGEDNGQFIIDGNVLKTKASFDFEAKSSYSIRVQVKDPKGLSFEKTFAIAVKDLPEVPTDITLSSTSIDENQAAGTPVGSLSATVPNGAGNTGFTFTLVNGTGDKDNGQFKIEFNELKTKAVFNFEAKSSYSIRVRVIYQQKHTFDKNFTIEVKDINEAPIITSNGGGATAQIEVLEKTTAVTTITAVDPEGATMTFSISGGANKNEFEIDGATGTLSFKTPPSRDPDNLANNIYEVEVSVSDGVLVTTQKITIILIGVL